MAGMKPSVCLGVPRGRNPSGAAWSPWNGGLRSRPPTGTGPVRLSVLFFLRCSTPRLSARLSVPLYLSTESTEQRWRCIRLCAQASASRDLDPCRPLREGGGLPNKPHPQSLGPVVRVAHLHPWGGWQVVSSPPPLRRGRPGFPSGNRGLAPPVPTGRRRGRALPPSGAATAGRRRLAGSGAFWGCTDAQLLGATTDAPSSADDPTSPPLPACS